MRKRCRLTSELNQHMGVEPDPGPARYIHPCQSGEVNGLSLSEYIAGNVLKVPVSPAEKLQCKK